MTRPGGERTMTSTPRCAHCTRPFTAPPSAPHKRFCSARCRTEWHETQRRRGLELLRALPAVPQGTTGKVRE